MTYGYYSSKRGRKQSRSKTKQLELRRILASLTMAAGILAYPFGAAEATDPAIARKDGLPDSVPAIVKNGNVYTIAPEGRSGDFAYNRFKEFTLNANQIANLKFGNGSGDAATLANLVSSKVSINGIVNAVKDGKIDGHLIFLSPNGIAVGQSGVINAGQFTGIVPTEAAFNTMYNSATPESAITKAAIDKIITDGAYAAVKTDAEGGTTGTIDISGKINTHSGVMLGAGIININDGAVIQSTKSLNFKDLVNIKQGSDITTNAGLENISAETAVEGSGGDIILTAKQTSVVKDTKTENNTTTANPIRWKDRSTDLNAAVNIGTNILGEDETPKGVSISSSDKAVKITAESTSEYKDSTPMTLTGTVMKDLIFGGEETAIDGLIDKLAGAEASANKYLFVNYSNKKNKSSVNVGANSTITGKNIDIEAKSTVDIKQSVAGGAAGKTDSNGNAVQGDSKAVAAVAISRVYNNADIVIDGNLTANGADTDGNGIRIAANADTTVELSATGNGGNANAVAIGVAVLSGDTKAKVTVNAPANATALSATQGKVSIDATTKSDIGVNVNAVGTTSYVSSNVGVANYDTSADVTVNRSITAGAVGVNAANTITGLKMTVSNEAPTNPEQGKDTETRDDDTDNEDVQKEKNKGNSGKTQDEINSEKKSVDPTKAVKDANVDTTDTKTQDAAGSDGKGGVQDVKDKVEGTNTGGDNAAKTSAFGLGASVGVVSNTNNANVTIGKNVVITATKPANATTPDGSVNINAKTLIAASPDKSQLSVKNALANDKVEIGAAVLVSNVKNNANILLDSDGTNFAQITGSGAVALNAAAGTGKYKEKDANGNETGAEKDSVLTYAASAESTSEEDAATFALDGSVGVNTLKNNAVVFLGQKSKVEGTEVKLSSDAATKAEGTYGTTDENSKVGIGATVGIQNIRNNSLVMAGKDAELKGSDSLEASANNSLDAKNTVKNAGKGDSVGISGMVALSYGDSNSIVSIDDEAVITAPSVSVESENSTNVDNSARSNAEGGAGSKAFGIGVGIVNYDVNSIAMVADNGSGITAPSGSSTDVEKAAQKIYNNAMLAQSVARDNAGKLGAKTAETTETTESEKPVITTDDLSISATTTGMLKNDAKANAVSKDADSGDDKSEKWTNWSKQGKSGSDEAKQNTQNLENDTQTSQNESAAPNASGAAGEASQAADPDGSPAAPPAGSGSAGASIGVEGSVALTFLGGRTDAVLDNVTVKNGNDGVSSVDLSATDFLGSITLGGTSTKNTMQNGAATKVGIGGTFAMNSSTRNVDSLLRNSKIDKVSYLANEASKIGIEVAAGMGTSGNSGSGTSVSGAGVVYYNKAVQDVHALMINNTVTSNSLITLLSNEATSTDFQIAGGLAFNSASGEGTNVGVGGAVAVSQLENNLASGIIGGTYNDFTTVKVEAEKGTTQINGALAATKAGGASGYGFEGAFAYGSVKNSVHAYIDNAMTQDTLALGEVRVRAGEVSIDLDAEIAAEKQLIDKVTKLSTAKKTQLQNAKDNEKTKSIQNKQTLTGTGFDPTGKIYLDNEDTESSIKGDGIENTDASKAASDAAGDEKSAKSLLDGNYSRTITAAMAGGWGSEAGAGAGIAYNYVKNDIAADITNSKLATYEVTGEAASDSLIVSVGAGVAVGGKAFNGAGSGSWNDLKNDTKVNIANNTITGATILSEAVVTGLAGGKLTAKAENTSSIFNIAGEVAGGKGMALGLSLAYNSLNNTTGSYLTGNTVSMPNIVGDDKDSSVNVTSLNKSNALAVAGGVDVSIDQSFAGAVGTVAINRGVSNTESVIDGKTNGENTTLDNLNSLVVAAEDVTKKTTVAGGISVGGSKVGIGGSVAYTSVGSSKNKEKLRAEINNADVTTTQTGVISVSATDSKKKENSDELEKSRITTVGAGFGVGWGKNWFGLQGAAAVSDIYKDSKASLNNTNINKDKANAHPTIDVTADTKSKINTVGAVGNISITGKVTGTAGVAINRINQDTKAEMATDDGKTTTVNAGRTRVRAAGDADIHSVGVGGTISVAEYVAIAGSGSYNYIGNNVDAIVKNQKLTSNNNVGVVAQSDDRLYNFAGAFNIGAGTRAALGAAVGINKITGSTNALVSGGSVAASGSAAADDAITVSRPQDADLYKTESLDVKTNTQKLSDNRTTENKTGIVVDSSATHTLISQMSSGGVAASASVGVGLAGTVNLNTVEGSTTAKIKDAALNSENNPSNINVNAIDYTNLGSFTGTPSVGAAAAGGVSLGVSTNVETLNRTTAAEISSASEKKKAYAKDLTVDATAKHGSSTLSFAAAAGAGAKVGVASGDSIVRHKNTSATTALLKNMDAEFDGAANIRATHLGNSYTQNISASASGGLAAVAAGAGVSVVDDVSTVKAEVSGSDLKAKDKTTQDVSVLADNTNNWRETLVTASLAVGLGAGLAANVGIHNTTGETAALVTNSQLEAHNVNVKATDKLTAYNRGGVGAAGVGGIGVSVALNNINSSTSAQVAGGKITASNDVNVQATEERSFDSSVTGVAVGGLGVGVNVAVTSVGKGITKAQLSSASDEKGNSVNVDSTTKNEINLHLNGNGSNYGGVNGAKGALGVSGAKFAGLSSTDSDLSAARNMTVSLDVAPEKTNKQGVHTSVKQAVLTADGNVNVKAQEQNDVKEQNVTVTVGGASVGVTDAIIHTNYDTDVTLDGATVTGRNVNVEALQGQKNNGSEITVTAVSVGAGLGVGVGYAGIVNNGATDVNITNSSITATGSGVTDKGLTVNAKDDSKSKTKITNVGVSALNVTTTFASVENNTNVGVTLGGTNNIAAAKDAVIDAEKANALEAHTQGVGVGGVAVAVNHATIEDEGNASAKITGTTNVSGLTKSVETGEYKDGKAVTKEETSAANKFHLGATNNTTGNLSAGNVTVSILGVSRMRGKGVMNMGAEVGVAGGSFNAKTAEFSSMLGNSTGRTLEGNVKGHNISVGVAVAPDAVVLNTTATGTVNVANSTFGENTDLILDNESYVDRKAYIYDVTAGAVAVGNSSADVYGKETLTTTLAGIANTANKLNNLQVITYGENKGKAFADAGGGGLVGYVGAHVRNDSINDVTSNLSGTWETAGDVWLIAAQSDEVKLTASEGHGGVIGVGGTSADNYITTNTSANVAGGTVINADRVHIGTSNVVATGAYDDTDNKGVKDVQTYTLKDHFGGAIAGNRLRSLVNLTENGTVDIGANAKITTNGLQEYIAASQNDLSNLVQAKGGAAVGITDAVSEFDLDVHNKVNVGSGALLTNEKAASTEDIILSAYDNQNLKSHVDATTGAAAAFIKAYNDIDMNRTSDVNVAGTIESGAKVGLYAGAKKDGALSNLNADLKAGAYNYSAVPATIPRVKYDYTDRGYVDVSGTVRSTGDINVIASGGKEEVVKDESVWNWAKGGSSTDKKFLTSDATTAEESLKKNSTVRVTGSLIAGTSEPIELTIDGSVANGLTITAPNNRANNRVKSGVTQGTFDYANTLGARLTELNNLIASYDGDATKMAAYIAERDRIKQEMVKQGLVEKDKDGNIVQYLNSGRSVYYVEIPDISASGGNINVQANDLIGTGNLHANSAPSVTITNNSDAYLKINNIIMGEQGGKIVYNKDNVITPDDVTKANTQINGINVSKSGASFREIYGVKSGEAAGLSVLNTKTFSGDKTSTISLTPQLEQEINNSDMTDDEKAQTKQAIRNGEMKYTAITDVEVNGKVSNFFGNVTINNASGNIRISGGTKDRPTGVEGYTVTLVAGNGTIAQDYKEGIVNINGDPEKYLQTTANALKQANALRTDANDAKSGNQTYSRSDSSQEATGYIAGRDVYVSAANVNVNGLIQSGYRNYGATITKTDLAAAKTRPASRAAVVQNRTMYKVNDGGAKWNDTDKVFDYVAQVYWDPSTDKLVVEDIDTQGGKIYLTGKIASTGDGRILAADGAANISVENETALDMNVGNVLNNQREGVVTIADTAKNTWTEYRKGQTRTINNYTDYLQRHRNAGNPYARDIMEQDNDASIDTNNGLSVGNTLTYDVKGNQVYSWINGASVETTATYQHYERRGFWGLVQTANDTTLQGWTTDANKIEPEQLRTLGLPEGAIISQGSSANLVSGTLYYNATNDVKAQRTFGRDHWVRRSGFLGWFKHIYDRWKVGTSSIQLYNYSLNASQPITIGLIGAEVGKIDIKSTNTAGGSINLTGNVANSNNLATLTVSSAAGKIAQFDNTTLKSEIVNLTAKDDISNIHLASVGEVTARDAEGKATSVTDNIKLSAVSTGAGDIDITAVGGVLENRSLPGNVEIVGEPRQEGEIVGLKSQNGAFANNAALGDVTLTASGNITQSGTGVTVEGRGITLSSKNGGIGTAEQAIRIAGSDLVYSTDRYGAQINASAQGDIYLTETGGDMRVGKIESRTGDVTLTVANGGFIDALPPSDDTSGSNDSVDEMVHRWIDAGLIDGEKNAQGEYTYKGAYIEGLEKSRDDYKANVEAAYDVEHGGKTQAEWQAEYTKQKDDYQSYLTNKAHYDALTDAERKALEDNGDADYAAYKSADKYYSQSVQQTYLLSKNKYDAMSEKDLQALENNHDADYAAYKYYTENGKYETVEDYLRLSTSSYKYSKYATANAYLEADATYQDLAAKADPANRTFEWTKDMMLYAVSDKIVNKESGSTNQTDGAANVLGHNVTLSATKGMVGTVSDQTTTIKVADLTGNNAIENMKKLMKVGASDVTANRDENGNLLFFTIKGNMPLGVFLKEKTNQGSDTVEKGTLNVTAGGNVSVAGRKDAEGYHSAINVGTIDATQNNQKGDVRLHSELGIYNAKTIDDTNITGKNLIVTGGTESIGTADKPLTVSLTGDMTEARANKNVFIKNMNNNDYLRLGAMFAGDTISLTSEKGFLMSEANTDIATSYINAGKKLEFLTNAETGIVGGIIDDKDYSIRILNDRAPVSFTAQSASIWGVKDGTLTLGNIKTKDDFTVGSDGRIAQSTTGAIIAQTVNTYSGKSLLLENEGNQFNSINVDGVTIVEKDPETGSVVEVKKPAIDGDVRIKDNSNALTVSVNRNVTGDISVQNLYATETENGTVVYGTLTNVGDFNAAGSISLSAKGDLTQATGTTLKAGTDVMLTSTTGSITQNTSENATTGIQAPKVTTVSANSVDLQGAGNQFATLAVQSANANVGIQGSITVLDSADKLALSIQPKINGNITVENKQANGVLQVSTDLQAKSNGSAKINLKSDGSMQIDKNLTAESDVALTSVSGAMTVDGNVSGGTITLQSVGNMKTNGKLTAHENVNITSTVGDVSINGDVTTGTNTPTWNAAQTELTGTYNSLTIHAGGAITEAAGVKIDTPVVKTYSGKGVSMESKNNVFSTFMADALTGNQDIIDGGVKVVSNYAKDSKDDYFTVGLGADVRGDAEFTSLDPKGSLGILIWNPDNENDEIKVLGGNGAKGSLILKANQDVNLLGDANAAHDIVIDSKNGTFDGIARGMTAGNNVLVSVGEGLCYMGGAIQAGNDIHIQALQPGSTTPGIYIGALPSGSGSTATDATTLKAGNNVRLDVNGDGNIVLEGNVTAGKVSEDGKVTTGGDVVANISGEGSIVITKSVDSKNGSVSVQTETGDIYIGTDSNHDEETIKAKQNISIGTDLGTIHILGKTKTTTGDITMKAGKEKAEFLADEVTVDGIVHHGNFIIRDDGKLVSGGGINLNGRNGDIHITDDIQAAKGITASITEMGSVYFDRNVTVTNDVNITTDEGDIEVGHTVTSNDGTVSLKSGSGDISVGKDITAAKDISISTHGGDVVVGYASLVEGESVLDGDVLSKTGNVSIRTDNGDIEIVKTVTAQEGSIDIAVTSGEGDISIGSNGPTDLTVHAKQNINLATQNGVIEVCGKTKTDVGDITVAARDTDNDNNLIIKNNGISFYGELDAASDSEDPAATGNLSLQTYNGDIEITDHTKAKGDINAKVENKGSIAFGVDVSTDGNLNFEVDDGDIIVGKNVTAVGDIAMTAGTGNIIVGSAVTSEKGNVGIQTGEGLVAINKSVTAQQGSIDVQVGTGGVTIGNNGPGVETVTAYKNIDIGVDLGRIEIYGKTSTKTGDISMSAAENQYIPGGQNIIIAQNGELDSAQDARLTGRNGDLHVTDAVKVTRNLDVTVHDEGDIALDRDVNVVGNTTINNTGRGSVYGHDIVSGGTTHVALTNGDLFLNLAEGKAVVLRMENTAAPAPMWN